MMIASIYWNFSFVHFFISSVVAALRSIISSFLIFVTQIKSSLFLPCPFFPVMRIKLIYSLLRVKEELWCPTFLWMTVDFIDFIVRRKTESIH